MAALSALSLFCLSACDDQEEAQKPTETPAAPQAKAAEEEAQTDKAATEEEAPAECTPEEARNALFRQAVYTLAAKITDPQAYPTLTEDVKTLLQLMETYYTTLTKDPDAAQERAQLSLQMAETLRAIASNRTFDAYTRAQSDFSALSEDFRNSDDGKHQLATIETGLGFGLLMQGKASEALPHYTEALRIAQEQYDAVAPGEGVEMKLQDVPPTLFPRTADLIDSLRCLGECQRFADDPEEARATFLKGHAIAQFYKVHTLEMHIAHIKLLTAYGDLSAASGNTKEAIAAWTLGAQLCNAVFENAKDVEMKLTAQRLFTPLARAIQIEQQKAEQNGTEEGAEGAGQDENHAQTEPISPELSAAAEAAPAAPAATPAEPAAAPAAAKPAPAKPAKPAKPANKGKRR